MRLKILVLFSAVVLSVGLAITVLLLLQLGDTQQPHAELRAAAQRAVQLARLQWQADQLQREAWLAAHADEPWIAQVFLLGTGQARGDAATESANRLLEASTAGQDRSAPPTLSLFIDRDGLAIGRNSVALMRGDPIAQRYPEQWRQIQSGLPALITGMASCRWMRPSTLSSITTSTLARSSGMVATISTPFERTVSVNFCTRSRLAGISVPPG